jgi:hypothetical protein
MALPGPAIARLREWTSSRAIGAVGTCLLLLLAGPGRLAAQDCTLCGLHASAEDTVYHLLPEDSRDYAGAAFSLQGTDAGLYGVQPEAEIPRWEFLERHQLLFSTLIPVAGLVLVAANSLIGY